MRASGRIVAIRFEVSDADANGVLNITDPVWVLLYMMLAGPQPRPPFPDCGGSGCLAYPCP